MSTELTLTLPPDLAAHLRALAARRGLTLEYAALVELRRSMMMQGGPSLRSVLGGTSSGRLLPRRQSTKVYMSAPVIALVEGLLTDEKTVAEALQYGDFGLGTLNHLDGEVVVLDGVAYQQGPTGGLRLVGPEEKTPFMCLTEWRPECVSASLAFDGRQEHEELLAALEDHLTSNNLFYAVKVTGAFESLRLRSVKKQEVDRPLVQVAGDQAVFEVGPTSGTLVGFWSPAFIGATVTVPGFHFHFLSDDKTQGGHVLESVLLEGTAEIMALHHAHTSLPKTEAFHEADLSRDPRADLEAAE